MGDASADWLRMARRSSCLSPAFLLSPRPSASAAIMLPCGSGKASRISRTMPRHSAANSGTQVARLCCHLPPPPSLAAAPYHDHVDHQLHLGRRPRLPEVHGGLAHGLKQRQSCIMQLLVPCAVCVDIGGSCLMLSTRASRRSFPAALMQARTASTKPLATPLNRPTHLPS